MAFKSDEVTINGWRYIVTKLPAKAAYRLLIRIGRTVGPAMASGMDGDAATFVSLLFEKLTESEFDYLLNSLCEGVVVIADGKKRGMMEGFDLEYADRLMDPIDVLKFVFEFQYGPIYAALLAAAAAARNKAAQPEASA